MSNDGTKQTNESTKIVSWFLDLLMVFVYRIFGNIFFFFFSLLFIILRLDSCFSPDVHLLTYFFDDRIAEDGIKLWQNSDKAKIKQHGRIKWIERNDTKYEEEKKTLTK